MSITASDPDALIVCDAIWVCFDMSPVFFIKSATYSRFERIKRKLELWKPPRTILFERHTSSYFHFCPKTVLFMCAGGDFGDNGRRMSLAERDPLL